MHHHVMLLAGSTHWYAVLCSFQKNAGIKNNGMLSWKLIFIDPVS
jgi:hypothetical protein